MTPTDNRTITQILFDGWQNAGLNVEDESKKYYKTKLEHGVWMVEFVKADGSTTFMECTLDNRLLPPLKEGSIPRPEPANLLHVYSLDRKGWRSFHLSNVKSFFPKPESL